MNIPLCSIYFLDKETTLVTEGCEVLVQSGYIFYFHLNSLTNKKEVLYVITVDTIHTPKVKYNPKHYSDLFSFARGLFLPGLYFATRYYKNRNTFSKFYSANKTSLMKAKHFYSGCGLLCTM
jgi:hypothetical protein